MFHENILYRSEVRRKKRKWWHFPWTYTESESIPLKEKIYTFEYNLELTGITTQGESSWSNRMISLDSQTYAEILQQFKRDFIEFQKFPNQ